MSVTVVTTGGTVYVVGNGASAETAALPTGELYVEVFGPAPGGEDAEGPPWLASFGNGEVVYKDNEVAVTAPAAENAPAKTGWV